MKYSLQKTAESLCLTPRETYRLRETSRAWLETVYNNDNERIVRLCKSKNELAKQARRFIDDHGIDFFAEAIKQRVVMDLKDPRLIAKVVKMMSTQVEYKSRKIKEHNTVDMHKRAVPDTESEHSDASSDSNGPQLFEDLDYEPSNATLDTPRLKRHNTRVNTLPGMPLCQSIEVDRSDGNSRHLTNPGIPHRMSNLSFPSHVAAKVPTVSVGDGSNTQNTPMAQGGLETHKDSGSDTITVSPLIPLSAGQLSGTPIAALSGDRAPEVDDRLPQICDSQVADAAHAGAHGSRLLFRPESINFDDFLIPDATSNTDFEVNLPVRSSPPVYSNKASAPRCEQTPPSSARSMAGARHFSLELLENMDSKPRLRSLTEDVTDQTGAERTSIFVTADHYEVIQNRSAANALQCLFDLLNDRSRRYQKMAQRSAGSLIEKKEAERKAIWMCKLLSELKDSRQIWDPYPDMDNAIEIL